MSLPAFARPAADARRATRRRSRGRRTPAASRRRSRRPARGSSGRSRPGRSGCARAPGAASGAAPCPGRPAAAARRSAPWYSTRSRDSARLTMSTYSRVRASGLANRTPCQPSDTCGPETPRPEPEPALPTACRASRRSSRSWSGCGPGSAGSRCRRRCVGSARRSRPARDGVRAVGLGGPHDGETESLGLADEGEIVAAVAARSPVTDVQSEPHRATIASTDEPTGAPSR